jgi:pyruvate dehydrogenase E1 component alpha subunit
MDQFDYVFTEMTEEIAAQRDEFAAYLASFEGAH